MNTLTLLDGKRNYNVNLDGAIRSWKNKILSFREGLASQILRYVIVSMKEEGEFKHQEAQNNF